MKSDPIRRWREKIDRLDSRMLRLLNERAQAAIRIGKVKAKVRQEVYAPERERRILDKMARRHRGPFPGVAVRSVFREILSACRSLQSPFKVAYLGPEATFTHGAALQHFGQATEYLSGNSIAHVFEMVEARLVNFGVVPIENSTEGVVTYTLDRLLESPLQICGEIVFPIIHCLVGQQRGGRPERIYSHAQATAQCRRYLDQHYRDVPITHVVSTARAAQLASQEVRAYAIASELAARQYGLAVIQKGIEDQPGNMTRFLILGKKSPPKTKSDKTSLVFSVRDQIGVLYEMLRPFHDKGINLSKIESRPMARLSGGKLEQGNRSRWEYAFFLDLDGHMDTLRVRSAISELEAQCVYLKILGSYPRGE